MTTTLVGLGATLECEGLYMCSTLIHIRHSTYVGMCNGYKSVVISIELEFCSFYQWPQMRGCQRIFFQRPIFFEVGPSLIKWNEIARCERRGALRNVPGLSLSGGRAALRSTKRYERQLHEAEQCGPTQFMPASDYSATGPRKS